MRNGNILIDHVSLYLSNTKYLERKVLICKIAPDFLSKFGQYLSRIIYYA